MYSVDSRSTIESTSRSQVGVPIDEARLTAAAIEQASTIVRPGSGRILLRLTEVELGLGRPDIVLISLSRSGLVARAERGLRLANLTEAQILVATHEGTDSQHSSRHVLSVNRRLHRIGWLDEFHRMPELPRLISQSVLIEAKMRDWRTGIQQLARTAWAAQRSVLLIPEEIERLIPPIALKHNRLGLVVRKASGQLSWQLRGRPRRLSLLADLWLTELAIRHLLEDSSDQICSSVANFDIPR